MREIWTRWVSVRWGRNSSGRFVVMAELRPYPKGAILPAPVTSIGPLSLHRTDSGEPYYLAETETA